MCRTLRRPTSLLSLRVRGKRGTLIEEYRLANDEKQKVVGINKTKLNDLRDDRQMRWLFLYKTISAIKDGRDKEFREDFASIVSTRERRHSGSSGGMAPPEPSNVIVYCK